MKTNFNSWIQQANDSISNSIAECFNNTKQGGWQENHITTQVLKSLVCLGTEFDWEEHEQRIKWEAYKLRGNLEQSNGDIGLLVNVRLSGEIYIKGVAFYEAKKQYFDTSGKMVGFKSVKLDQLSRVSESTHASSVLFYDVQLSEKRAAAISVPSVFVFELEKKELVKGQGRVVLRYGFPWILSLGQNFRGYNLDYQVEAVKALEEYVLTNHAPAFLLNLGIGFTSILEPKLDDYCASLERYKRISVDQNDPKDERVPYDENNQEER